MAIYFDTLIIMFTCGDTCPCETFDNSDQSKITDDKSGNNMTTLRCGEIMVRSYCFLFVTKWYKSSMIT